MSAEALLGKSFLVVQDLFLHETAQAADVVLPAASAYEKSGTVTNTCGELQRLRKAVETLGARPDFQIILKLADALGASLRPSRMDDVLQEIRESVPGYDVSLARVLAGGAELVRPSAAAPFGNGAGDGRIVPASDTLFTSGTLTRYSHVLQSVPERLSRKLPGPV